MQSELRAKIAEILTNSINNDAEHLDDMRSNVPYLVQQLIEAFHEANERKQKRLENNHKKLWS